MRAIGSATILVTFMAISTVSGRAATLTEDFTIDLTASGFVGNDVILTYGSSSFPKFDPSLGTLTEISETLTGSTVVGGTLPASTLEINLADVAPGQSSGVPGAVAIDLEGTSTNAATLARLTGLGDASTEVSFAVSGPPHVSFVWGLLGTSTLDGSITYDYAVPEPSTWAMMALGFAGLGAMGWRGSRRAAV
jgi:hypothetical protein